MTLKTICQSNETKKSITVPEGDSSPCDLAISQPSCLKKSITIDIDSAGQRIDNFLFRHYKNVPKSHIYKLVRKGAIKVNNKKVKAEYKLQEQDLISLPEIIQDKKLSQTKAKTSTIKLLEQAIVYEDEDILVLNKPSGLAVHAGSGVRLGVIEIMRQARPKCKSLELVHRLDRETSGLLMLAKKRSVLRELHELLRKGKIHKSYLLLVKGPWQGGTRKVTAALLRDQMKSGERIVEVKEKGKGKESITIFHPQKHFPNLNAILLLAELKTGRTHQIRVHASHIGHPIAGDTKYGDKLFNASLRKLGLSRLFLHAAQLKFKRDNGASVEVTAPLPEELKEIC